MFSNELARRYGDDGIASISLFPGAVKADLSGYAGSFLQRVKRLVGTCICFIVTGGDLEALAEDQPQLPQLELSESSKVYHRATTSLYAGTAPEAGRLGGKVVYPASIVPDLTTYRTRMIPFQYLTAWARLSLPSKMALDTRLAAKLWDWCEDKIMENTTYCKV